MCTAHHTSVAWTNVKVNMPIVYLSKGQRNAFILSYHAQILVATATTMDVYLLARSSIPNAVILSIREYAGMPEAHARKAAMTNAMRPQVLAFQIAKVNTIHALRSPLQLNVGNGVMSVPRSAQINIPVIANQFARVSTIHAHQFFRLKIALNIVVSAPKTATQITALYHLNPARATVKLSIIHAELRTIRKHA